MDLLDLRTIGNNVPNSDVTFHVSFHSRLLTDDERG